MKRESDCELSIPTFWLSEELKGVETRADERWRNETNTERQWLGGKVHHIRTV